MRTCATPPCADEVFGDRTSHDCCVIWAKINPDAPCVACLSSKTINREHQRRARQS